MLLMDKRQRRFAICGGICGVIYLINLFYPLPDFLRGFVLGLAIGFLILALLPDEVMNRLRKWKYGLLGKQDPHGE